MSGVHRRPSGRPFDFKAGARETPVALADLCAALSEIGQAVSVGGVVAFFPSYAYLEVVVAHAKAAEALQIPQALVVETRGAAPESIFKSTAYR